MAHIEINTKTGRFTMIFILSGEREEVERVYRLSKREYREVVKSPWRDVKLKGRNNDRRVKRR